MTRETIAHTLEDFIRDRFQVESDDDLFSRELNLWEEGYLDSAGVVELIAFMEERFQIEVPRAFLVDPSFTHIDGMAARLEEIV